MQRMQKMLVFPTKNAENVQKAMTVAHFQIFLHVSFDKPTFSQFSAFFLTLRPGPKAVSTLSHQTGISQNAENAENVCISNQKYRKRAKSCDSGTFLDFSVFFL